MSSSRLPWLALTLIAVALVAAYGEASTPTPSSAQAERLPYLRALAARKALPAASGDPFATAAIAPVPAAATEDLPGAVAPAPNLAPSLPWRVIGKQHDERDGWAVFLARGAETLVVRVGDTFDARYRVVAIQPPALTLQSLDRHERLTLDIGEAQE
ncbi:hypothetical protein [Sulfuricystis multivorans]|uniref:hypothetical protein n=1 Tax=Sulfuricystis multivorans TaxID=2211108 RepID=UPI0024DF5020|nr:hypothetical protein [Sulfuricystis multivorans]